MVKLCLGLSYSWILTSSGLWFAASIHEMEWKNAIMGIVVSLAAAVIIVWLKWPVKDEQAA